MNATERARRSDSLYYDTQVTNRRALCDMIAHLESVLAESKAENDKLRERIHELEMEGSDHFYRTAYAEDANRTLEAENAKLRELARDMCVWAYIDSDCDLEDRFADRMAELGIEVG